MSLLLSVQRGTDEHTWFVKAIQAEMLGDNICFFFPFQACPMHSFAWIFSYIENSRIDICLAISYWPKGQRKGRRVEKMREEGKRRDQRIYVHPISGFFVL